MTEARGPAPIYAACTGEHCITCADEGVPMVVVSADAREGLAECVDETGQASTVEIMLVAPVEPGQQLLVHAGTAIAALQVAAAERAR